MEHLKAAGCFFQVVVSSPTGKKHHRSSPQNIVSPTGRFPKYRRSPVATRVSLAEVSAGMDGEWIRVIQQTA